MLIDAPTTEALLWIGAAGALVGLIAGFLASAKSLIGISLMGVIGAISGSAIMRIAGVPAIYGVGDDFSFVWAALGAFLLAYVVGRSNS